MCQLGRARKTHRRKEGTQEMNTPPIDQYTAPRVREFGNASAQGLILAFLDRMSPEQAQATIDLAQGQINKRNRDAMASRAVQAVRGAL